MSASALRDSAGIGERALRAGDRALRAGDCAPRVERAGVNKEDGPKKLGQDWVCMDAFGSPVGAEPQDESSSDEPQDESSSDEPPVKKGPPRPPPRPPARPKGPPRPPPKKGPPRPPPRNLGAPKRYQKPTVKPPYAGREIHVRK